MKLKGAKELQKALRDVAERAPEALLKALKAEADEILEDAKRYAPEATGRLKRSGQVSADDDTVAISFDTPYAVVVHERMDRRGNKFLERALLEHAKSVGKNAATAVEKELKKL